MFYFSAKSLHVDGVTKTAHTHNVNAFNFFGFVPTILCKIFKPTCISLYRLEFN